MKTVQVLINDYRGDVTTNIFYDKVSALKAMVEIAKDYNQNGFFQEENTDSLKTWDGGEVHVELNEVQPFGQPIAASNNLKLYVLTQDYLGNLNTSLFTELDLAQEAMSSAFEAQYTSDYEPDEQSEERITWNGGEVVLEITEHIPEGDLYIRSYYVTKVMLDKLEVSTEQFGTEKEQQARLQELVDIYGGKDHITEKTDGEIVFGDSMVNIVFGSTIIKA